MTLDPRPARWYTIAPPLTRNYGLALIFITPLALTISAATGTDDPLGLAGERISDTVLAAYAVGERNGERSAFDRLSPREREVLQLMAEGRATKEIAHDLGVSIKTIETHRRQVMEKLKLYSVAELTKYAVREGLTSVER